MVKNGIDNIEKYDELLVGKRIGLITGPTGLSCDLNSTVDIISNRYKLTALFAPEHGIRGDIQAGELVEGYVDPKTGIYVHSLYGKHRKPSSEMLKGIDVLVFDIQDIGARYYTYLYTLTYAMECGLPLIVLDRVNPINGMDVEGPILNMEHSSFVGKYSIPARYGLTIGEFAMYINKTYDIGCDLTVIPCLGYKRNMYFEDTGLCFVPPSPNIPTVDSAICYIGTCLIEGTNLSEGRGTTKPFEVIGAPWLDSEKIIQGLQKYDLQGVKLRAMSFVPTFSKHCGEHCNGLQLHITNRAVFKPFITTLYILQEIMSSREEFSFIKSEDENGYFIDKLLGSKALRDENFNAHDFIEGYALKTETFTEKRKEFFIY